jgi:hypothetical protein
MAGAVSEPAWKTKPRNYLVASDDKMIPLPAQRKMAERAKARVTEVAGSHAVYVSKPHAVAKIRGRAATLKGFLPVYRVSQDIPLQTRTTKATALAVEHAQYAGWISECSDTAHPAARSIY